MEKNLAAFLALDLPGSKVVYGVGPLEAALRRMADASAALARPDAARTIADEVLAAAEAG